MSPSRDFKHGWVGDWEPSIAPSQWKIKSNLNDSQNKVLICMHLSVNHHHKQSSSYLLYCCTEFFIYYLFLPNALLGSSYCVSRCVSVWEKQYLSVWMSSGQVSLVSNKEAFDEVKRLPNLISEASLLQTPVCLQKD